MRPPKPASLLHLAPLKPAADAIAAAFADPLKRIDPLRALADTRARPLVGPALAQVPVPLTPLPPALQPGAPPRDAQFYVELGLTCEALREFESAATAFRKATEIQSDLRVAWLKLADVLTRLRINAGAAEARARAQALPAEALPAQAVSGSTALPAPAIAAASAKLERQVQAWAKRIRESPPESSGATLRDHLRRDPTDVAALRVLAGIGASKGLHVAAQHLLERALALAPFHRQLRMEYVALLMAQSNGALALPVIESLIADDPDNLDHRTHQAICLAHVGEFDRSLAIFEGLLGKVAADPNLMVSYSYALRYAGRGADSARVCRDCIARAPGIGRAWWALADLRRDKFTPADIETMRAALDDAELPAAERYHLHYALGHALEQAGDFADSFSHYASGAALKRAELKFDITHNAREMARQRAFFTASRLADRAAHGHPDPAPIFIFGLPRVGSTLIEQILASHSAVEGTKELFEIADIAAEIGMVYGFAERSLYPERIATLSATEIAGLGARYIDRTRKFRRTPRPFFIDKMPGNWTYLGLIQTILPNAKLIDARRHPVASGFAAFKQLFGSGMEFSYNLAEFGGYYNEYLKTMAHFDHVLPGRVHRVIYENLVTDTESEIRRLLDYCGLPFEPGCLRFWETERAVATPSAEQVRQPISRAAKDQWRNYEPWLGPLKTALNAPGVPPWNKEAVLF